jgi:hypothetical protein
MIENDDLVKLYTGADIIINRIKMELEARGINTLIKDGFKQGLAAGFGEGVPSAIDIFVTQEDFEKANEIVNAIIEE